MNGVQTRFKCKLDVKRCKRFVFPPSSLLPRSNALKTKAIRYFQTDRTLTRIVSPPLNDFPHFIHYNSYEDQIEAIGKLIEQYDGKSIGILFYSNELVLEMSEALTKRGINMEYKCKTAADDKRGQGNLHFTNTLPKVLTYHSAKGLQFDVVIIPKFEGAITEEQRKSLYVAMTRTMHHLYVLYSTDKLAEPLDLVPANYYKKI